MKINNELKSKWPWKKGRWEKRAQAIAEIIPQNVTVLELGGGLCYLSTIIDNPYKSIDKEEWTDVTTKADFNKGEFPELGLFDVIICQGIIEYIENPIEFLWEIKKYGRRMIMSYKLSGRDVKTRTNRLNFEQVDELLKMTDWFKVSERTFTPDEKLYYCTKL